jgi:hypothetical protein
MICGATSDEITAAEREKHVTTTTAQTRISALDTTSQSFVP